MISVLKLYFYLIAAGLSVEDALTMCDLYELLKCDDELF